VKFASLKLRISFRQNLYTILVFNNLQIKHYDNDHRENTYDIVAVRYSIIEKKSNERYFEMQLGSVSGAKFEKVRLATVLCHFVRNVLMGTFLEIYAFELCRWIAQIIIGLVPVIIT